MPQSASHARYGAVVGVGWLVLGFAAVVYARLKGIPAMVAVPVAAAFLIEFPFYLLPAFAPERLKNSWLLAASCIVPYLVYALPTGEFRAAEFVLLIAIALAISFWFRVLPRSCATDFLFLVFAASVYIAKTFDRIYLSPIHGVQLSVLGHVMLIHASAIAILAIRETHDTEFRFLPNAREIVTGLKWFAFMLPVVMAALWAVGLWHTKDNPNPGLGLLQLFGILWIVALPEEFFFRGLMQKWMAGWMRSGIAALVFASVVFGAAHLGFHRIFPNWRFAIVAAIFGLFCGLSWRESRSVQASMVTHAIGATLYRVFFQ